MPIASFFTRGIVALAYDSNFPFVSTFLSHNSLIALAVYFESHLVLVCLLAR
jgi:hypothetical protein